MKICDITFLYYPRGGGIKTYIDIKGSEFLKLGVEHIILGPNIKGARSIRREKEKTQTRYFIPSFPIKVGGVNYFIFSSFSFIEEILRKEKPDIIEISDKFTPLLFHKKLLHIKKELGSKVFVFSHERADNYIEVAYELYRKHTLLNQLKKFFFLSFEKILMKRFLDVADEVLCNSEFTAEEIHPLTKKPVHIIRIGLDAERFLKEKYFDSELKKKLSGFGAKKILLHVGRLDREKRIELLTQFAKLLDPRKYLLLVVGGGSSENEIKKIPSVELTGYLSPEEVRKYIFTADIGVLVNDIEPYGIVALEMMAAGLPILGPNRGGLSDILDSSFAWKSEHDPKSYLQSLKEWEAFPRKEKLSENARKIFLEHYTSRSMAEKLLSVYRGKK